MCIKIFKSLKTDFKMFSCAVVKVQFKYLRREFQLYRKIWYRSRHILKSTGNNGSIVLDGNYSMKFSGWTSRH